MIFIRDNGELKNVVRWEDIIDRDNFKDNHNLANASLSDIIGYYELPTMIRCGLSSCHTEHKKGYLVSLNDGCEINIGHTCGSNAFDVEFEKLSKEFQNFRQIEECKVTINEAKTKTAQWGIDLNRILNGKRGAKWASRQLKALVTGSIIGKATANYLNLMVKYRNATIEINEELTDKWEIAQRKKANPRMHFDELKWTKKSIGYLDQIEALFPENDLQHLIIKRTQKNIQLIEECDPYRMSLAQLTLIRKTANDIPKDMENCDLALIKAKQFLSHSNLKKLLPIFEDQVQFNHIDKSDFENFLKDMYKSSPKRSTLA